MGKVMQKELDIEFVSKEVSAHPSDWSTIENFIRSVNRQRYKTEKMKFVKSEILDLLIKNGLDTSECYRISGAFRVGLSESDLAEFVGLDIALIDHYLPKLNSVVQKIFKSKKYKGELQEALFNPDESVLDDRFISFLTIFSMIFVKSYVSSKTV